MLETKLSGDVYTFVFLAYHPMKQNSKAIMFNTPDAVDHAWWMA